MRVLLTGASGFIGGHTAHALIAAGHDLRALVRSSSDLSGLEGLRYERVVGDLGGPDPGGVGLTPACAGMDAVVHAAGVTRARTGSDFHRVNAQGTAALARAAAAAAVPRFLYISSLAAQGPSSQGDAPDPAAPCHPITPYGDSKAAGEAAALAGAKGGAVQILRPSLVYGPRDSGLLPFFQMARRRFITRLGDGWNRFDLVYGPDLAEAVVSLLAVAPAPSPYFHLSDGAGPYTWREIIAALADAFGHRIVSIPVPALGFAIAARASMAAARLSRKPPRLDSSRVAEMRQVAWLSDNTALAACTGWTPRTSLAEGLRATVVWYRANGWI